MDTIYFVDFATHNYETDGWNFKQTKKFASLSEAKKEFHTILSTYIEYGKLDHVVAIIWDCYGNVVEREYWHKDITPEPNVEE